MAQIEIVIPRAGSVATGNRATARTWAGILKGLGHEVTLSEGTTDFAGDLLIAVNAVKCRPAVVDYRTRRPDGLLVVCLSGTDINGEGGEALAATLAEADRLVVLQEKSLARVPPAFHAKARVIRQGVTWIPRPSARDDDRFRVCVVGHLRAVKDPLRAAWAARLLPADSRIEVVQVGAALDEDLGRAARDEMSENPRYRWLGQVSPEEAHRLIADSDLMVLSSHSEGGPRVVSEASVAGTPIVSTRIDGVTGLLGIDYPGYFEVGDTAGLAALLSRAETDPSFLEALTAGVAKVAARFDPRREREAWRSLLSELTLQDEPNSEPE